MVREAVFVAVLQDEIAAGMEDVLGEHLVGQSLQSFEGIRRIREHNVELLVADGKEIEAILIGLAAVAGVAAIVEVVSRAIARGEEKRVERMSEEEQRKYQEELRKAEIL